MQYTIKDYQLTLIDEPNQSHVVDWEKASRAFMNEDAKPRLARVMTELKKIRVSETNLALMVNVFQVVSTTLTEVLEILEANESLSLSAHNGMMVKAAFQAGWIKGFVRVPAEEQGLVKKILDGNRTPTPLLKTVEDVDKLPPWLVKWVAEQIGLLYLQVTDIPKN